MASLNTLWGCRYFTHYGDGGKPGTCNARATLQLLSQPDIIVCDEHAARIAFRFPLLGTVEQRFVRMGY